MSDTKTVSCSYSRCGKRRVHHERPDEERGQQTFEVPAHIEGPWYCSVECWMYARANGETQANAQEA